MNRIPMNTLIEDTAMKEPEIYMTAREVAELVGFTVSRVNTLCAEGKVAGVLKAGRTWLFPKSSVLIDYDDNSFPYRKAKRANTKSD